jgi:hypothetical protein
MIVTGGADDHVVRRGGRPCPPALLRAPSAQCGAYVP